MVADDNKSNFMASINTVADLAHVEALAIHHSFGIFVKIRPYLSKGQGQILVNYNVEIVNTQLE